MEDAAGDDVGADYDAAIGTVIGSVADFEHWTVAREGGIIKYPVHLRTSVASGTALQAAFGLRPLSEGFAPGYYRFASSGFQPQTFPSTELRASWAQDKHFALVLLAVGNGYKVVAFGEGSSGVFGCVADFDTIDEDVTVYYFDRLSTTSAVRLMRLNSIFMIVRFCVWIDTRWF